MNLNDINKQSKSVFAAVTSRRGFLHYTKKLMMVIVTFVAVFGVWSAMETVGGYT